MALIRGRRWRAGWPRRGSLLDDDQAPLHVGNSARLLDLEDVDAGFDQLAIAVLQVPVGRALIGAAASQWMLDLPNQVATDGEDPDRGPVGQVHKLDLADARLFPGSGEDVGIGNYRDIAQVVPGDARGIGRSDTCALDGEIPERNLRVDRPPVDEGLGTWIARAGNEPPARDLLDFERIPFRSLEPEVLLAIALEREDLRLRLVDGQGV